MFLDLLRKRRSIRSFEQRPLEKEKIDILIEAVLRSPSSKGRRPWEIILITDPKLIALLATVKPKGADFLARAPLCIAICADPGSSDVWIEDCAIAAIIIQLAAEDLGLGSCWSQIRSRQDASGNSSTAKLRFLLDLPEHLEVASIIGIGYPVASIAPHTHESLPMGKIHKNSYRNRS